MKKSHAFLAAAGALGVACALLLLWVWRQDRALREIMASAPAPAAKPKTTASPARIVPPAPVAKRASVDGLLAALEQALAARDARPHEAVLTFKDDAARQRFVDRARQAGLTVISRLDRLRAVR